MERVVVAVVHQPQVFPAMHLVQRVLSADVFVQMNRAQINRRSGMARFEIMSRATGAKQTMAIPLHGGNRISCSEARVAAGDWHHGHLKSLEHLYGKAPFGASTLAMAKALLATPKTRSLADLGLVCLKQILQAFGPFTRVPEIRLQSELISDKKTRNGSELVLELVSRVGGGVYLCGRPEDRPYLDEQSFESRGIRVRSQNYVPPPDGNLSYLHYLAWHGPKETFRLIMDGKSADHCE